jgi:hypothetical protein
MPNVRNVPIAQIPTALHLVLAQIIYLPSLGLGPALTRVAILWVSLRPIRARESSSCMKETFSFPLRRLIFNSAAAKNR